MRATAKRMSVLIGDVCYRPLHGLTKGGDGFPLVLTPQALCFRPLRRLRDKVILKLFNSGGTDYV